MMCWLATIIILLFFLQQRISIYSIQTLVSLRTEEEKQILWGHMNPKWKWKWIPTKNKFKQYLEDSELPMSWFLYYHFEGVYLLITIYSYDNWYESLRTDQSTLSYHHHLPSFCKPDLKTLRLVNFSSTSWSTSLKAAKSGDPCCTPMKFVSYLWLFSLSKE